MTKLENRNMPLLRPLSRDILALCATGLIITPNERLRRELIRSYNHQKLTEKQLAWPSAPIQSLLQYCRQRVEQDGHFLLLSEEHEQILWRSLAPLDATPVADLAQKAWQICHEWNINWQSATFVEDRNSYCFQKWATAFQQALIAQTGLSSAQLIIHAVDCLENLPETIHFYGFDHIGPSLKKLMTAFEESGCRVSQSVPDAAFATNSYQLAAEDDYQEIQLAAAWAKERLQDSEPATTIGIVVPDLGHQQHKIQHALTKLMPSSDFNISGGVSLVNEAVCVAALNLIRWCGEAKSPEQALEVLNSPFFGFSRCHQLNPKLPGLFEFDYFAAHSQDPVANRTHKLVNNQARKQSLKAWVSYWITLLNTTGWPGDSLASRQFQAKTEFEKTLFILQQLPDAILGDQINAEQAVDYLVLVITGRLFSPASSQAPIQVLGYLESLNLEFSALWVMGMADARWPTPNHRNPLIPHSQQLRAGVTRITPESEYNFALATTRQWQRSAEQVIFSYPLTANQAEFRPSGIIADLPVIAFEATRSSPRSASGLKLTDRTNDTQAPGVTDRQKLIRASRVLSDQAQCPFRAWAIHRLQLEQYESPHSFPNYLEWGILVHDALHQLYATPASKPAKIASDLVKLHFSRFPKPFCQREEKRLAALLERWQQFEADIGSTPDEPIREQDIYLSLAGTKINLRIDRIDSARDSTPPGTDAGHLIIDYKTGNVSLTGLLAEPPAEPQLALYVLATDEAQAVCFAQVNQDKPRLAGISNSESYQFRGMKTPEKASGLSWQQLKQRWQSQLTLLMREYFDGNAQVVPRDKQVCERCHIRSICRVQKSDY